MISLKVYWIYLVTQYMGTYHDSYQIFNELNVGQGCYFYDHITCLLTFARIYVHNNCHYWNIKLVVS